MYYLIAQHKDFIVVSKYRGVCVHCEPGQPGLMVRLKHDFKCETIFPVHRLDKVTSGLLVCAKNSAAASTLSQQFEQRSVEKYYLAISDQKPKKKQGLVRGDMERGRRGAWKLCHSQSNPAVTQFFSTSLGAGQRLFVLKPKTGKTHQLRVALKSLGSPIVGDRLYGHPESLGDGIFLHAYVLGFEFDGVYHRYIDPPLSWSVSDHQEAAEWIKTPWEFLWPSV